MKRFSFRLETLLGHRKNLEEKERNELYRLKALYQQESTKLELLTGKQQATLVELAAKRSRSLDAAEIGWFYSYLDRLRFEMEQTRQRMARLEKQIQIQKAAVVEAVKKTKVLNTLRSKKEKAFVATVEKEEQKAIDEMVVLRYPQKAR